MEIVLELIKLFCNTEQEDLNIVKFVETYEKLEYSVNFNSIILKPSLEDIKAIGSKFSVRDQIIIDLKNYNIISTNLNSDEKLNEFLSDISDYTENIDLKLTITINKQIQDQTTSIYSIDKFIEYLSERKIPQSLYIFNKIINNQYIKFEVFDSKKINFNTSSIYFYNKNRADQITIDSEIISKRTKLLEKQLSNCHFANASEYQLIPEDFYFQTESNIKELNDIFKKLSLFLSIIYIFDVTSIKREEDEFYFKLNGNRTTSKTILFKYFNADFYKAYFEIYKWAYGDGTLSDKLGIAQNIISLHIKNENIFEIRENTLNSIKSGYKIYLKQNVKQYIEVKNKISDYLFDFSQKANKIVDSFSDSFKKSSFAIFSLILARLFGKDKVSTFFTPEIINIAYIFIAVSSLYWLASIIELLNNKKRYDSSYKNMKNRYVELLEPEDLNNIFNNDNDHKENKKFICFQAWIYSLAWLLSLGVLLGFIFCSSSNNQGIKEITKNESVKNHLDNSKNNENKKSIKSLPTEKNKQKNTFEDFKKGSDKLVELLSKHNESINFKFYGTKEHFHDRFIFFVNKANIKGYIIGTSMNSFGENYSTLYKIPELFEWEVFTELKNNLLSSINLGITETL